ncbi:MAG: lysophospholipid acyltransferase family protein [Planctomycetes bacterium]|nr:lysophospholipid acyltransferase family protein [Planctomycetota bacterium]
MRASYGAALRAARAAAALAPELLWRRSAVARENLRLAFGRPPPGLIEASCRHFAEAAVDLLYFDRLFEPARFDEHFRMEGDGLAHYRETGPLGAVFVTGHFGNWELFGAAFRHLGIPIAPVARPLPWLGAALDRFRRAHGQETIPKREALPLAMRAIRRGLCVAFLADQSAGREGIPVPFFGHDAHTIVAPAALALKLKVPLYAGYSTRLGDGIRYRCFAEHVPLAGDAESMTRRLNAILEGYVRACPEQWWWFHRRFKPPKAFRRGRKLSPAGVPL